MHNLKDIRANPEKYKTGLEVRGENSALIDSLLVVDEYVRAQKTIQQERQFWHARFTKEYGNKKAAKQANDLTKLILDMEIHFLNLCGLIAHNEIEIAGMDGIVSEKMPQILAEFKTEMEKMNGTI